jgi:hypothetical protein
MSHKARLSVLVLLLAVFTSCSKCQKGGSAQLAGLVPGDTPVVVVFPDLSRTIADFNGLLEKFSVGPAASFVKEARSAMTQRLGFDPLRPEEWSKIGVNPGKGMALALWPGESIVIAGISDQSVFEAEVKKRMKELLAADQVSSSKVGGQTVTTIGTKLGTKTVPRLHYILTGGYALLSGSSDDPGRLAAAAAQKPEQSMAKAQWYSDLTGRVTKDADLMVMVNGRAAYPILKQPEPEAAEILKEGFVWAFSIASVGLSGEAFLGLDQEASKILDGFSANVKDAHLERYLPADTVWALKIRANTRKVIELLWQNDPGAKQEFEQALAQAKEQLGVDLRAGTIDNLSGNAVVAFSLGKPEQISRAIASKGRGGMGEAFGMNFWIQLKDGATFTKLLEQALDTAGDRLPATRTKAGPVSVIAFPEHDGIQANVLYHQNLLGLCLGKGCPETAGKLVGGKGPAFPSTLSAEARKLFESETLLVGTLKFGQLLDALSGLDASSMGEGGMMVKVVLDMVIGAVKNLREATAVVKSVPGGVAFKGHLRIQ